MLFTQILSQLEERKQELGPFIVNSIDEGAFHWERERHKPPSGSFHISSLGSCLRDLYYRRMNPIAHPALLLKKFYGGVDSGQRVVDYLRRAGTLFGSCLCRNCLNVFTNVVIGNCPDCGSTDVKYSETGVRDLSIGQGISGKIDVMTRGPKGKFHVVEAKSASTYYKAHIRENVIKHLSAHIQQGNMYVGLLRRHARLLEQGLKSPVTFYEDSCGEIVDGLELANQLDLTSFALAYEDKNSMDTPVHEFIYDHDMYLTGRKRVRLFFHHVDTQTLPTREESKNCKYCDFKDKCGKRKAS